MSNPGQGPRVGWVGQLPPAPSGIAEYSAMLLPELARRVPLIAFNLDGARTDTVLAAKVQVRGLSELPAAIAAGEVDLPVYQFGNHPVLAPVRRMLLTHPGVLVLHDLFLHHHWISSTLDAGDPAPYIDEMRFCYGEWGAQLAVSVTERRREAPFFDLPLCERLVGASLAVGGHSRLVLDHALRVRELPVRELPQLVGEAHADRAGEASVLPREPGEFRIGIFGDVERHKRIESALLALRELTRRTDLRLRMVIVGTLQPYFDARELARRHGVWDLVTFTGRVPAGAFDPWVASCDVALSLRHPTVGETSAAVLRQMAAGVPTVVSDSGAMRELPAGSALKVAPGPDEALTLAEVLERLSASPSLRRQVGEAGRRLVRSRHLPVHGADAYQEWFMELHRERAGLAPGRPHPAPAPPDLASAALLDRFAGAAADLDLDPSRRLDRAALGGLLALARDAGLVGAPAHPAP
ncbi:MAG: glycosyltransferase family 4 protein [Candidatus Dormibacteria bacterium]